MSTMHCNNGFTHTFSLLLFEGQVHLACKGLLYGHKDQTLLIDDEPSKALRNPKWSKLFLVPFRGRELSKNKVQWLNFASRLWPTLKRLAFARMVYAHFVIIM
jgi:hypothetical protein